MDIDLPLLTAVSLTWLLAAYFFLFRREGGINVARHRSDAEVIAGYSQVVVKVVFSEEDRYNISSDVLADVVYRFGELKKDGTGIWDLVSKEQGGKGEVASGPGRPVADADRSANGESVVQGNDDRGKGEGAGDKGQGELGARGKGQGAGGQGMGTGMMVPGSEFKVQGSALDAELKQVDDAVQVTNDLEEDTKTDSDVHVLGIEKFKSNADVIDVDTLQFSIGEEEKK